MALDKNQRDALREYLAAPLGVFLRVHMDQSRPDMTGKTIEERALSAAERQGYENAVTRLSACQRTSCASCLWRSITR